MSWHDCAEADCRFTAADIDPIETVVVPRAHDVGGFEVRRALPSREKRLVGPFVFFDQMGPGEFLLGRGLDVRPHPHIGLATVTYLFRGEILHRDSLGTALAIRPGAVNWMTAGRGIAHSERTPPALRAGTSELFGIQAWVALPKAHEETPPAFAHHPEEAMPLIEADGVRARVIAGELWGARSPVPTLGDMIYADVALTVPTDQRRVLEALRKVPYGRTVSVEKLVGLAGFDTDSEEDRRTVETALRENPVPLFVPDHRVRDGPSAAPPAIEQRLRSVEGL